MRLAAYQPDIPQNTGALIRLCAGLNVPLDLIEPFGFIWDERKIRTAAMDYFDLVSIVRHSSWASFLAAHQGKRIILLSTKAAQSFTEYEFRADDVLLLGRESAGVPQEIHDSLPEKVKIPMAPQARSLNMAMAGAMILSEALRQTSAFPNT